MKRVLFVAELGSGFGHVRRLLPLARAARRAGHRAIFLVANPVEAALADAADFAMLKAPDLSPPAPAAPPRGGPAFHARSFADILDRAGFGDAAVVTRAIEAWRRIIDDLRPDAAVCELSPYFCLATFGGSLPVLVTGYGFVLPPPDLASFPAIAGGEACPPEIEARALATVGHALGRIGRAQPQALPAIFAGRTHAVTGLDALDPYRAVRSRPAVGPPGASAGIAAPSGATDDVFGYLLGESRATLPLLRALGASGARGRVYVRRPTSLERAAISGTNIAWLDAPVPMADALARARLAVHHGSMLTSEECLLAGRPQLVLPLYLEHLLTTRALLDMGVGRVVRADAAEEVVRATVETAMAAGNTALRAAEAVAHSLPRPPPDLPERLLRTVL